MKIFRNGEFSADYNGPRTAGKTQLSALSYYLIADGIVAYMEKQSGPSSRGIQ